MVDEHSQTAPAGGFPATRWSVIVAARSVDPAARRRAFDQIAGAYWKPGYKYIRARWRKSGEDAQDLTQEFFVRVVEKDTLAGYDPARSRLRTYMRTCVDALLANAERDARRQKRGGGAVAWSYRPLATGVALGERRAGPA